MKKSEIEQLIADRLRRSAEEAIQEAVRELNATGRKFAPTDQTLSEWVEPGGDESLSITCAIGVGLGARSRSAGNRDPVAEAFIARAESGADREATLLNLLEGDIANGGFLQLFENKGESFIRRGIILLREIGARSAAGLVEQALGQILGQRRTLKNYGALLGKLDRLAVRFAKSGENIPALYERHLQLRMVRRPGRQRQQRKRV